MHSWNPFRILHLEKIDITKYTEFIKRHFNANGKDIADEVITTTYDFFNGITWYIQKMMNEMFSLIPKKGECTMDTFKYALEEIRPLCEFDSKCKKRIDQQGIYYRRPWKVLYL